MPGSWVQALVKYPLDVTGQNPNNKVSNEPHVIDRGVNHIFAPNGGPFYVDSLIIYHPVTGLPLTPNLHFKVLQPYQDASVALGQEVACVIYIDDLSIIPENEEEATLYIEYQVVGGAYSWNIYAINSMLSTLTEDVNYEWGDIVGKLDLYPSAPHLHPIDDFYGWNFLSAQLEGVRLAIEKLRPDYVYPEPISDEIVARLNIIETWISNHGGGFHDDRYYTKVESNAIYMLKSNTVSYMRRDGDTMQGPLILVRHPQLDMEAATRKWVLSIIDNIGINTINDIIANHNHDGRYYSKTQQDERYVRKSGDTMDGAFYLARHPEDPMEAATKQWVEGLVENLGVPQSLINQINEMEIILENHTHDNMYMSISKEDDFVKKEGDTMQGPLYGSRDAIEPNEFVRLGQLSSLSNGNGRSKQYTFKPIFVVGSSFEFELPFIGITRLAQYEYTVTNPDTSVWDFKYNIWPGVNSGPTTPLQIRLYVQTALDIDFTNIITEGYGTPPNTDGTYKFTYPKPSEWGVMYLRARWILYNPDDNFVSILETGDWCDAIPINNFGNVNKPSIVSPTHAQSINPTTDLTITSSAFSYTGTESDTHVSSRWVIRTGNLATSPILFDSGFSTTNKTSITIPPGTFEYGKSYVVEVMYRSENRGDSLWSLIRLFNSGSAPSISTPSITYPSAGMNLDTLTPTITSSAYVINNGSNTHVSTDWEIRALPNVNATLYYSANSTTSLISLTIPVNTLVYNNTYYVRVRYRSNGILSNWSAFVEFKTAESVGGELIFTANSTTPGGDFELFQDVNLPAGVTEISMCLIGKGGDGYAGVLDTVDPNTRYKKGFWDPVDNNASRGDFRLQTSELNFKTYDPESPKIAKTIYGVYIFAGNKWYHKPNITADWTYKGLLEDLPYGAYGPRTNQIWVNYTSVIAVGTIIYFFGGRVPEGAYSTPYVFALNTQTNTLDQIEDMGYARSSGSVAAIGNEVYFLGGKEPSGINSNLFFKYNALDHTTSLLSSPVNAFPNSTNNFAVDGNIITSLNGYIYAISNSLYSSERRLLRYNPSSNVWDRVAEYPPDDSNELFYYTGATKENIPIATFHGSWLVTIGDTLYGYGNLGASGELKPWGYTPSTNKFNRFTGGGVTYRQDQCLPYSFNDTLAVVYITPGGFINAFDSRLNTTITKTGVSKAGYPGRGGEFAIIRNYKVPANRQLKVRINNNESSFGYLNDSGVYVVVSRAGAVGRLNSTQNTPFINGTYFTQTDLESDGSTDSGYQYVARSGSRVQLLENSDNTDVSKYANYQGEFVTGAGGSATNGWMLSTSFGETTQMSGLIVGGGGGAGGYVLDNTLGATGEANQRKGLGTKWNLVRPSSGADVPKLYGGGGGDARTRSSGTRLGGGGAGGIGLYGWSPTLPSVGAGGRFDGQSGAGGMGGDTNTQYTVTTPNGGHGNGYGAGAGSGAGPVITEEPGSSPPGDGAIGGPGAIRIIWGAGRSYPYDAG